MEKFMNHYNFILLVKVFGWMIVKLILSRLHFIELILILIKMR